MNQLARARIFHAFFWLLVLALFAIALGCSAIRSAGWTAGGGAAGAAVGSLAGPGGTIVGAGVGAGAAHMLSENGELRDGDLVGEEALRRELSRRGERIRALEEPSFWDGARRSVRYVMWALALLIAVNLFVLPRGREGLAAKWKAVQAKPVIERATALLVFMVSAVFMALGMGHSRTAR